MTQKRRNLPTPKQRMVMNIILAINKGARRGARLREIHDTCGFNSSYKARQTLKLLEKYGDVRFFGSHDSKQKQDWWLTPGGHKTLARKPSKKTVALREKQSAKPKPKKKPSPSLMQDPNKRLPAYVRQKMIRDTAWWNKPCHVIDSYSKPKEKEHKPKTRKCLRCRAEFLSEWPGERVCKTCKSSHVWRAGNAV